MSRSLWIVILSSSVFSVFPNFMLSVNLLKKLSVPAHTPPPWDSEQDPLPFRHKSMYKYPLLLSQLYVHHLIVVLSIPHFSNLFECCHVEFLLEALLKSTRFLLIKVLSIWMSVYSGINILLVRNQNYPLSESRNSHILNFSIIAIYHDAWQKSTF